MFHPTLYFLTEIDIENLCARVEPGVRNLALSEATRPHGLYYAPDPSSQIACSIGGNVAENSGGIHCLKYGLTVHNVIGLKIVTAEGELSAGSWPQARHGETYLTEDRVPIIQAFIVSDPNGTLGIS